MLFGLKLSVVLAYINFTFDPDSCVVGHGPLIYRGGASRGQLTCHGHVVSLPDQRTALGVIPNVGSTLTDFV